MKSILTTISLCAVVYFMPNSSLGTLHMQLAGQPGSTDITFQLSGTSSSVIQGALLGLGTTLPTGLDVFGAPLGSIDLGLLNITSGGAKVTTIWDGAEYPITHLFLQDKSARANFTGDRFGVRSDVINILLGGEVSWSGSGTIDLAGQNASFDNLTPGTYHVPAVASEHDHAFDYEVTIIPEPKAASLLLMIYPLILIRRNLVMGNKRSTNKLYFYLVSFCRSLYLNPKHNAPIKDKWM